MMWPKLLRWLDRLASPKRYQVLRSKVDDIAELGIDEQDRLYVVPASERFPMIYREAMEVNWDPSRNALYSPKPREWSYSDWLTQIVSAAHSQGVELKLSASTKWNGITAADRCDFESAMEGVAQFWESQTCIPA